MMIISFGCGLGNQMFEYAFLTAMRQRYPNTLIKIDPHYMLPQQHNGYELDRVFGINEEVCNLEEVIRYSEYVDPQKDFLKFHSGIRKVRQLLGIHKSSYFHQRDFTEYYKNVFHLNPSETYYLHGIWANEHYFKEVKPDLKKAFTFSQPLNKESSQLARLIQKTDSVSIHIRKGDYEKYSGLILQESYYKKAINYIKGFHSDLTWFVFSDDINYARGIIGSTENAVFVDGNTGVDSWRDMYLMSLCSHNIIANSSFSFWAAFLNANENKIVISSKKPFNNCKNPFSMEGWIQM